MRRLVGAAALLLVLTGCSGGDGDPTGASTPTPTTPSATPEPTPTEPPYLPVPKRVELTEQGSDLRVGERATVAWEMRKNVVGALDIRVTRVERASIEALEAFKLDRGQRRSTPFYVRATVRNVGRTNLAEVPVPLYVANARHALIQATPFAAAYKPCTGQALPKPFRRNEKRKVCLVYLMPEGGRLQAVTFRPTEKYDPISWTGPIKKPKPVKPAKSKSGG